MSPTDFDALPVAIIGAGPVGLAAAAHALERGLTPLVLEKGNGPGAAIREWGHVRLFSPWAYDTDAAAVRLLEHSGWSAPAAEHLPNGGELVANYLEPLAALPDLAPHLKFGAEVVAVTRLGLDRMNSADRERAPFVIRWHGGDGVEQHEFARAVIDASGTWHRPGPMGVDGLPVPGEHGLGGRIAYGIPDVLGSTRNDYAGRHTLVVGGGHSAINVVLDLLELRRSAPGTKISWALRRGGLERLEGGGLDDALPARGALGLAARRAVEAGELELLAPFAAHRIAADAERVSLRATLDGRALELACERIVVATGFRPEHALLSELRVEIDPVTEAPPRLAPLIDPNIHSCGTVPPHGAAVLRQPEPGLYVVGAKSYGRAPTFLMKTGYEQVRSVVAELAGDHASAAQVELVLPETGVCSGAPVDAEAAGCCGGPAPEEASACCVADARAKQAGLNGCGCGAPSAPR